MVSSFCGGSILASINGHCTLVIILIFIGIDIYRDACESRAVMMSPAVMPRSHMSSRVRKSFELGVLASTLAVYAAAMGCSGGSGSGPDASPDCEVPALLQERCAGNGCHGGGATIAASLDLISPNVGQRISDRMSLSSLDPIVRPGRPRGQRVVRQGARRALNRRSNAFGRATIFE